MIVKTNQNNLILILIVVLGFAAGYIYYSQVISPARTPIDPPLISAKDNLRVFDNLTINFSILDNEKYKALQIFGESPVSPGVTGKKDIFAPI